MITISAGHWHVGTGAKSIIDEVTEARKVAKEVTSILRNNGVTTSYIEDNLSSNQAQNLTYLANEHAKTSRKIDVFVHFNSAAGGVRKEGIGTEVFYKTNKELAAKLTSAMAKGGELKNRGAKFRNDLYVLNAPTTRNGMLLEVCFVNSEEDVAKYKKNFRAICEGIAITLAEELGIKFDGKLKANNGALIEFAKGTEKKKVFRVQSGPMTKEEAVQAAMTSGFKYNSLIGSDK